MSEQKEVCFEDNLKRLEEIVNKIESGSLSLDESLALYEEGNQLIKKLNLALKEAKDKIEKYQTIE